MEILEQIGLTNSESKVYMALIELGLSTTGKIIEKSNIASSKIYEILEKLMQKGLVSSIVKEGVKHFEATSPRRILDYINEKEEEIEKQKIAIEKLIPELELKQQMITEKSEVTVYKGIKGVETAFYESLKYMKKGETLEVIGVGLIDEHKKRIFSRFNKLRAEKGVNMKIVFNEQSKNERIEEFKEMDLVEYRFTQEMTPAAIDIFKDRVLMFPQSKEPIAIVMENKEIAESFRVQFKKLWDQRIQIYEGIEGIKNAFYNSLDLLNKGENVLVMSAPSRNKELNNFFIEFTNERAKRKINLRIIFDEDARGEEQAKEKNLPLSKIKFIDEKTPAAINIFKDRVLLFPESKDLMVVSIDNKEIAESFREKFESYWDQRTRIFQGDDGFKQYHEFELGESKKGETICILGVPKIANEKYEDYLMDWNERRIKKGVHLKILYNSDSRSHGKLREKLDLTEVRYMKSKLQTPAWIDIFQNYVVTINVSGEPVCFLIEDKVTKESYEQYFNIMWEQAEK